jgi:hypothetical protein
VCPENHRTIVDQSAVAFSSPTYAATADFSPKERTRNDSERFNRAKQFDYQKKNELKI